MTEETFSNPEAEKAIISLAFADYDYYSQLASAGINEKWFALNETRFLWGAFSELYQPPAMEVYRYGVEKLIEARYGAKDPDRGRQVLQFLEQAVSANIPVSHLERNFNVLLAAYQKRLEQQTVSKWLSLLQDKEGLTERNLREIEQAITEIRRAATPFEVISAAQMAQERQDWYNDRLAGKQTVTKIPFEQASLNDATNGGAGLGELTWWIAEQGRGKTALLQRDAYFQAVYQKHPVLYVTLEMNRAHWIDRVMQQETGISSSALSSGKFQNWRNQVFNKLASFAESKLYLIDDSLASIETIKRAAEFVRRKEGDLKVIYVDYAQIIKEPTIPDRYSRYLYVSEQLSALAKQFNCHVHGIVRENKQGEPDGAKAFEYDCDNLVKLENDNVTEKDPRKKDGEAIAFFAKQRYGVSGRPAELYWNSTWARYTDPDVTLPIIDTHRFF